MVEGRSEQFADEHGKNVSIRLFAQVINAETYAICTVDLLLKREREDAHGIRQGGTGAH